MANKVDYFEIASPNAEAAKAFYGSLFGWEFGDPSDQYRMVNGVEGGLWDTSTMGGSSWAIFYVHVDDVPAAVRKAEGLGAKVVVPLISNERIEFSHLIDPDGNRFAVWHPKS